MGEQRLRGAWLIHTLCPSDNTFSSSGSHLLPFVGSTWDCSNGTEGSAIKSPSLPAMSREPWAADGAIGTHVAELTSALPLMGRSTNKSGVLPASATAPSHPDL